MYKIKSEHLNAILQYLGRQPYTEVAPLIACIQQCELSPDEVNVEKEQ